MMYDASRHAVPGRWLVLVGALVYFAPEAAWPQEGAIATASAGAATGTIQPLQVSPVEMRGKLDAFLVGLWPEARARGISRIVFDRAFADLTLDTEILDKLSNQPEHSKSAADYIAGLVSPERIEAGRRKLAELSALISRIEAAYGVDRHVLLAVWGVESNFGSSMGTRPVVRSLATLAFGDVRRPHYWRGELLTILAILQKGEVTADHVTGSWAGAMGHTQFMPASYAAHAVDFDGDGRRDIWTSVADALASTASFLKAAGWKAGEPWGYEAVPPPGFDFAHSAPTAARPIFDWMALGVIPPSGRKFLAASGPLQLMLPAGATSTSVLAIRTAPCRSVPF